MALDRNALSQKRMTDIRNCFFITGKDSYSAEMLNWILESQTVKEQYENFFDIDLDVDVLEDATETKDKNRLEFLTMFLPEDEYQTFFKNLQIEYLEDLPIAKIFDLLPDNLNEFLNSHKSFLEKNSQLINEIQTFLTSLLKSFDEGNSWVPIKGLKNFEKLDKLLENFQDHSFTTILVSHITGWMHKSVKSVINRNKPFKSTFFTNVFSRRKKELLAFSNFSSFEELSTNKFVEEAYGYFVKTTEGQCVQKINDLIKAHIQLKDQSMEQTTISNISNKSALEAQIDLLEPQLQEIVNTLEPNTSFKVKLYLECLKKESLNYGTSFTPLETLLIFLSENEYQILKNNLQQPEDKDKKANKEVKKELKK